MKAAVVTRSGSRTIITVRDVAKPEPGPGQVLVRVRAATVNRTDSGELANPLLTRPLYGRRPEPAIFGMDFAGEVEALGPGARRFAPGDRVFGMAPFRAPGAQAEYFCMAEDKSIALMPAGIPFREAAVCEGAFYASASIESLGVGPGHKLLIYGASGAIGTAAVQLAKYAGAEVTAVVATRQVDMVRSLGADHVVDYTNGELERVSERFDFVFDAVGKMSITRWWRLLKPKGVFATTDMGPGGQSLLFWMLSSITRAHKVVIPLPKRARVPAFLTDLRSLMEAGRFRGVVDRTYPLDRIADAYRYVQTGRKTGIVVIDIG